MRTHSTAAFAVAMSLLLTGCSAGGKSAEGTGTPKKPGFTNIVLSDTKGATTHQTKFAPDTPKLFVNFSLESIPNGDTIKGTWICEKSDAAPPNFKIDEAQLKIGLGINAGDFSMTKPTKGWPEGSYRIDLSWNDKVVESVKFTIEK